MAPSVSAETRKKKMELLLERLAKDQRIASLEKDVAELCASLDKLPSSDLRREDFVQQRASLTKTLRLKSRALASLLSTLSRLEMELVITSYE